MSVLTVRGALLGTVGIVAVLTAIVGSAYAHPDLLLATAFGILLGTALVPQAKTLRTLSTQDKFIALLILSIAITSSREEGLQYYDTIFGIILYITLIAYFLLRIFDPKSGYLNHWSSFLYVFFILWSILSISWSIWAARLIELRGDIPGILNLLLFFPIKDYVRSVKKSKYLACAIIVLVLFISIRNILNYREIIISAFALWQQNARVTTNEVVLLLGCLLTLTGLSINENPSRRIGSLLLFGLFFGSLVLTQTRAFWVDFVLGAFVLFLLIGKKGRRAYIANTAIGGILATILAYWYFGSSISFTVLNLLNRASTLNTSVLSDLSLMSRIYEAKAVMKLFYENPILGHGLGASYSFYDVIDDVTLTRSYVHNGYVGLMFKSGLVGTLAHLGVWASWIAKGLRASYARRGWEVYLTTAVLIALLPSAATAMHIYARDTAFVFALCGGWLTGVLERPEASSSKAA